MSKELIQNIEQTILEFEQTGRASKTALARCIIGGIYSAGFEIVKKEEEEKQFVECKCTNSLQAENCIRNCGHGKEPKQETHICKYCGAETSQPDDECYAKPKTLEEAAENYAEGKSSSSVFQEAHKKDFIEGYKLAQERMYSEEEVKHIVSEALQSQLVGYDYLEQWFTQFKKK